MTDCMHELESGQLHRFGDWPIKTVPKSPGVYTVWDQTGRFIYVGKATTGGLFGRLNSHANGRRGGDQFNVYVADRFVLHGLTREQVAQIGAGTLPFDELVRDFTRNQLGFRFCPAADANSIEDAIRAGHWPHGKKPMLTIREGSPGPSAAAGLEIIHEQAGPSLPHFDRPRHLFRQAVHPGAPHLGVPRA